MATFFSTTSTDHCRDLTVGGNMSYHHYNASSNPYSHSPTGGLIPLPVTIVPQGHGRDDSAAAFVSARDGPASGAEMGLQTQLFMANASAAQSQGLSLSIGSQGVPMSLYQQYRPGGMSAASLLSPNQSAAGVSRNAQSNIYIQNSRYLKAARELLDEVVNVRDAIKRKGDRDSGECNKDAEKAEEKQAGSEHEGNSAPELNASERQDLQNKVSALMALLDQVTFSFHRVPRPRVTVHSCML
jgi:hypothetical protein